MEKIELKTDDTFMLTTDAVIGDQQRVSVTFSRLPQAVKPGNLCRSMMDSFSWKWWPSEATTWSVSSSRGRTAIPKGAEPSGH